MISFPISNTIDYMGYYIAMSYATEHIAGALKAARKNKGLSQRELSESAGMPQGHISRIENGAVDLRLSSLISLARVLDLELALVPRQALPAVKSIARISERPAGTREALARNSANVERDESVRPAYSLDEDDDG